MSVHQSEALPLRSYAYAETHKIVVMLTRDFGQVRAIAYGAKSGRRNRFGSSLEPLTHVRATFSRRQDQELSVLQQAEILRPSPASSASFEINLHIGYFAELLLEFSREEQEAENLFRLVLAVLEALGKVPVELLARYFEFWLLKLEGVLPDLHRRLPAELAEQTLTMLRLHPTLLKETSLPPVELKRLERLAEELIEYQLEKRLKSKKMLKELL